MSLTSINNRHGPIRSEALFVQNGIIHTDGSVVDVHRWSAARVLSLPQFNCDATSLRPRSIEVATRSIPCRSHDRAVNVVHPAIRSSQPHWLLDTDRAASSLHVATGLVSRRLEQDSSSSLPLLFDACCSIVTHGEDQRVLRPTDESAATLERLVQRMVCAAAHCQSRRTPRAEDLFLQAMERSLLDVAAELSGHGHLSVSDTRTRENSTWISSFVQHVIAEDRVAGGEWFIHTFHWSSINAICCTEQDRSSTDIPSEIAKSGLFASAGRATARLFLASEVNGRPTRSRIDDGQSDLFIVRLNSFLFSSNNNNNNSRR